MKKLITSLITIGLITSSMTVAIMPPKRFAQCIWNPKEYKCLDKEKKEVKIWVGTASIGAIIALLALIGVTVGPKGAQKIKEQQTKGDINQDMEDLRNQRKPFDEKIYAAMNQIGELKAALRQNPTDTTLQQQLQQVEEEKAQWEVEKNEINQEISRLQALKGTVGN